MSNSTLRRFLGGAAIAALAAGGVVLMTSAAPEAVAEPQFPAPPANGEMGFVLTAFVPAVHQGKEDCPDGLAGTVRENFLEALPPAERTRLLLKQNEPELTARWKASALGPNNTNICANPEAFERPNQRTVKGKVSEGFDMDKGQPACTHEEFTASDGTTGIDNQAYRALGCSPNWRGVDGMGGDIKGFNNFLATGEHTMVVLLRGVDSLKDDPKVEVIFASTDDRPALDSKRNFISGSSFTVSKARWRNVLQGSIHNGVLTTSPVDMKLNRRLGHGGMRGQTSEYDLHQARIRIAIQPDGSFKGFLGAYQLPRNIIASTLLGGIGAATVAGIDCATEYQTLVRMADGLKDPQTGQCTGLSIAYEIAAVPAFVNDLPVAGSTLSDAR
jgi:hypothetical protein